MDIKMKINHKCCECGFEGYVITNNKKLICPICKTENDWWYKDKIPPINHIAKYFMNKLIAFIRTTVSIFLYPKEYESFKKLNPKYSKFKDRYILEYKLLKELGRKFLMGDFYKFCDKYDVNYEKVKNRE